MSGAYLYIGDMSHLRDHMRHELEHMISHVVSDDAGRVQHERVLWMPLQRRQHRREDIAEIFTRMQYTRSSDDPYMIILEYADCLTYAAANSMLKVLEEPPAGYYIFLLATCQEAVISTMQSRCHIYHYVSEQAYTHHALYQAFTQTHQLAPDHIDHALTDRVPTEYETRILLDALHATWMQRYRQAVASGIYHEQRWADRMLSLLHHAYDQAPVSGNVKVFWRTLCLQVLTWREQ